MNSENITTISAVFIGWLLGLIQQWLQTGKSKRETRKSTRRLIQLECASNAEALNAFWTHILARRQEWITDENKIVSARLGAIIADAPFPGTSTFAWINNAPLLSDAFSDKEIAILWQKYSDYALLSTLHEHLTSNHARQIESMRSSPLAGSFTGNILTTMSFIARSGSAVDVFKETIERVIKDAQQGVAPYSAQSALSGER